MSQSLRPDATLRDVRHSLLEPEKLLRDILSTMNDCRREKGNCLVRIGITGEGKAPYHKVAYLDGHGQEQLYGSYFGRNRDEKYQVHTDTWSTKTMTYEEVQQVLADVTGFRSGPKIKEGR